ncbi:hypothetical protein M758_10G047800 [Ceratodon purpureus]|nr:hypothetical protein M758_10G047800 [Ceratodon purpureus]
MATSQQWRHACLLMLALAVIFIASAEAANYKCPSGFKDCNKRKPGCETHVAKDVNNCGACGYKCKTNLPYTVASCVGGQCKYTCKAGRCNCDNNIHRNGCETDSSKDVKNCGGCRKVCKQVPHAETKCLNGKCTEPVCKAGWANCDKNIHRNGCETDTSKDSKNCGACGNVCKQLANTVAPSCANGVCSEPVCKPGWYNCDNDWSNGCETQTGFDAANCGFCGNVCPQYPNAKIFGCLFGTCQLSNECQPGFNNCNTDRMDADGCETPNQSDVNNCGGCYQQCPSPANTVAPSCVNGVCAEPVCKAGWANCDNDWTNGCETETNEDAGNCGGCGNVCPQYPNAKIFGCNAGVCELSNECQPGFNNCNTDRMDADGCEVYNQNDDQNCGGCYAICESDKSCVNGTCIIV